MNSNDEKIRSAIAAQAGEWLVANDDGPLNAQEAAALSAWFKASPTHIEEFLGVSAIARSLREARTDPEYSLQAILARARADSDSPIRSLWPQRFGSIRSRPPGRWLAATAAMAAVTLLTLGWFLQWNVGPTAPASVSSSTTTVRFATRHGEQFTRRLADNSVLHLNSDSAVTIRYGKNERLVMLTAGQAAFEVTHDPDRAFRVFAGVAEVVDVGTAFDVRLEHDSTVVTVVEGRVAVGRTPIVGTAGANANQGRPPRFVQLSADQQISVANGDWPAVPVTVDAQRAIAWMRRQMVFDHEPLERVAAEYNRYTSKPIEIITPGLRNLQISGVFATDDAEAFVAFLRSLKGVRVEVTDKRIRVMPD